MGFFHNKVFTAEGAPGAPGGRGGPPGGMTMGMPDFDGTGKYGKYIMLSKKSEPTERGTFLVNVNQNILAESGMTAITGRMPPPGPMPGHYGTEHDGSPEFLIHLGNHPDDPMDLGAEAELYLGRGKWREKYIINRSTAVYNPYGFWHCPWQVKKIWREMTWVNIRTEFWRQQYAQWAQPGAPATAGRTEEDISEEELAKAKTTGLLFSQNLLSGVGRNFKNPKGGQWIAYLDCTMIAEAPLTRIIRYRPEEAPYTVIDTQTHEFESFLILFGTDLDDCTDLGAEVEIYMGPEKEKHTFNKSTIVYVPAYLEHGPLQVKKAWSPFNFLEIVGGPEMPGSIFG